MASAAAAGVDCVYRRPLADPPKPPFITDYTWNHTTLWAIKADPSITYVQSGFGSNFREQFAELRRRFPGEILLHLEWTAGNAKMMRGNAVAGNPDAIVVGRDPARLLQVGGAPERDHRATARRSGSSSRIHTRCYLEDGGRHPNIADKRAFKAEVDPRALLNPGKMKTYPVNPFAPEPAVHMSQEGQPPVVELGDVDKRYGDGPARSSTRSALPRSGATSSR